MAALWFVAGALIGIGLVGFFTGLILALVGLALALYLLSEGIEGAWFAVIGAGVGAAALVLDDVLRFRDGSCIQVDPPHPFHACPPPGMNEILWIGIGVAVIGVTGHVAATIRRSRRTDIG